jgi:hypothetical protein
VNLQTLPTQPDLCLRRADAQGYLIDFQQQYRRLTPKIPHFSASNGGETGAKHPGKGGQTVLRTAPHNSGKDVRKFKLGE